MFEAKILCDSINEWDARITTVQLTYPRCIHAEFMTHRMFARNSASSRAIPVKKMLGQVMANPFVPIHWGMNQKGMQADKEIEPFDAVLCQKVWLDQRDQAVGAAQRLVNMGLHKQIANRLLEPWMWITVIATGNSQAFENFFHLRCSPLAEPHIQKIAYMLRDEYDALAPNPLKPGEWHLPLIGFPGDDALGEYQRCKVSVARCARVSYLTHDGKRDVDADLELYARLLANGHWSPFEHVARVALSKHASKGLGGCLSFGRNGNGWVQFRKLHAGEMVSRRSEENVAAN